MGPVTKNRPTSPVPQARFILYVFFERNLRRGSPASLSSPLVSVVSPNRGITRDGLCSTCSNRLRTSSNPVNSKSAWKWGQIQESWEWKRNYAAYNHTKERKHYLLLKETKLTRHNRVKNLRPFLSTHRSTQTNYLVTCRFDGRDSRIRGQMV